MAGSLAALSAHLLRRARLTLAENALMVMGGDVEITVSERGEDAVELDGVGLAMEGFLPLPTQLDRGRRP